MTIVKTILAAAAAACLAATTAGAAGTDRLRLELLVDGVPLHEHHARGTTYVEALRGREYSIRMTNLEPVRVAVALSVDGRNTIDARHTSASEARKWILDPWESVVIDGWQTSEATAARFHFTTEERSYAHWLGDASNAGLVEAVAYRERAPRVTRYPGVWSEDRASRDAQERAPGASADSLGAASGAGARAEAPSAQSASKSRSPSQPRALEKREADDEAAATGHGREVGHDVRQVRFEAEDWPSSTARIRYEYRDALVRLGVLPRHDDPPPHPDRRRERAEGFADGPWAPRQPR